MELTLASKHHLGGNAWEFNLTPAAKLSWQAGQFIKVDLPHKADSGGTERRFTIAAAPHEGIIRIGTRISRSSFKQALASLEPGAKLKLIDEPAGDFTWQARVKPHIFLAQGIGITPFFAIASHLHHQGTPINARLHFANRPGNGEPFLDKLQAIAAADPSFVITTHTEPFTPQRLAELEPDLIHRLIYVSGPTSFIRLCAPPYNVPLDHFKQDNFPNYSNASY